MIKLIKIIITIISLNSSISLVLAADYGNWSLQYYVDEFGDDTNDKYIIINTEGLFSNSATTNSSLYVQMLIDENYPDEPYFNFYEYGNSPVQGYYSDGHPYKCSMKNSNDEKEKLSLLLGDGSRALWVRYPKKFNEWMGLEETIKFACYEEDSASSKYVFKLNFEGYSAAMQALRE